MIRFITTCALIIFGAAYCQAQNLNNSHIELIQSHIEALVSEDEEALNNSLHADFMTYGPAISDTLNKEAYVDYWKRFWENQKQDMEIKRAASLTHTIEEGYLAGDWVFDWFDVHVTYQQAPDNPVHFRVHIAARIVKNKLSEMVTYYNVADIQQQLGYKVTPPGHQ